MGLLKNLWRKCRPNPFDHCLKRAQKKNQKRILLTWNRGLGDIPLGLYALVFRIRQFIPDAEITFFTRQDLKDGFLLLQDVRALIGPDWRRGSPFNLEKTLHAQGLSKSFFDLIIENPDPTYWVQWQLGMLTPRLRWDFSWDRLIERFGLEGQGYVGVHVQTETHYAYEKNWPLSHWEELFQRLTREKGKRIILFGFEKKPHFPQEGVIDLRGETSLFEMLALIKNKCSHLIVPDSGVLSMTYYLDVDFPIHILSLWADPRQGVLKQNVASPNKELKHTPLLSREEVLANISADEVLHVFC
jgi:ADP-heptose:LPS heptosyltransferase